MMIIKEKSEAWWLLKYRDQWSVLKNAGVFENKKDAIAYQELIVATQKGFNYEIEKINVFFKEREDE